MYTEVQTQVNTDALAPAIFVYGTLASPLLAMQLKVGKLLNFNCSGAVCMCVRVYEYVRVSLLMNLSHFSAVVVHKLKFLKPTNKLHLKQLLITDRKKSTT